MNRELAERLVGLAQIPEGQAYLRELAGDFDKAMKRVLACDESELPSARGHARALSMQLEKFTDAQTVLLAEQRKGKTS